MANIESVRYENPNPLPPAWATALAGMVQGGAGQLTMNQQQAAKDQQNQLDFMKSILPGAIQTQQVGIGQPPVDSGYQSFPQMKGMPNFYMKPKPVDAEDTYKAAQTAKINYDMDTGVPSWVDQSMKDALSRAQVMASMQSNPARAQEILDSARVNTEATRNYFRKKGTPKSSDPIQGRIDQLKSTMSVSEIKKALKDKGIDPEKYTY